MSSMGVDSNGDGMGMDNHVFMTGPAERVFQGVVKGMD